MIHRGGRTALYHSSSIIPVRRRAAHMYVIFACTSSIVLQMHNHSRILHSILLFNGLRWQKGGGVGLSLDRKSTRFSDCLPLSSAYSAYVCCLSERSAHNMSTQVKCNYFAFFITKSHSHSCLQRLYSQVHSAFLLFQHWFFLTLSSYLVLQRLREGLHASPGCHSRCVLQQILLSIVDCSACTQCSFRQSFILTLCSRFLGRGRHARELVQHSG